jgi:hypothetical protein
MMRRIVRVAMIGVLVLLALFSWYMAGFFARYEIVVGEERHFGLPWWGALLIAILAVVVNSFILAVEDGEYRKP